MRIRLLAISLMLLAVSCGGADDTAPTDAPNASATPTTEAPGATSTTAATSGTMDPAATGAPNRPATEGPAAPSFTTILSDGSEFALADESNPVYLVFWAEW